MKPLTLFFMFSVIHEINQSFNLASLDLVRSVTIIIEQALIPLLMLVLIATTLCFRIENDNVKKIGQFFDFLKKPLTCIKGSSYYKSDEQAVNTVNQPFKQLEVKDVTVLFADIRNYTNIVSLLGEEENLKFTYTFMANMFEVIEFHGGEINECLGDGILALFEGGTIDATRAAFAMQDRLEQLNCSGDLPVNDVAMGIGVAAGVVHHGVLAKTDGRFNLFSSEAIITAKRLETMTKHVNARILMTAEVFGESHLESKPVHEYFPQVKLKGREQTIDLVKCA